MVTGGATVEYSDNGRTRGAQVEVINFDNQDTNDWLAVKENRYIRISQFPDCPLSLITLNPI